MNATIQTALTATGSEQAVTAKRGHQLVILCKTAEVELRDVSGGAMFPIPANTAFALGVGLGQVVYLTATAGATIYLMET
jgi:hypothetical protein